MAISIDSSKVRAGIGRPRQFLVGYCQVGPLRGESVLAALANLQ